MNNYNKYIYNLLITNRTIDFKQWLRVIRFYNNSTEIKVSDVDLLRNRFKTVVESTNYQDHKLKTLMNQGKIKLFNGGCFE